MASYSITKHQHGRFGVAYSVAKDGLPLITDVPYLRARRALHAEGVSAETHLAKLDDQPAGSVHSFEVK